MTEERPVQEYWAPRGWLLPWFLCAAVCVGALVLLVVWPWRDVMPAPRLGLLIYAVLAGSVVSRGRRRALGYVLDDLGLTESRWLATPRHWAWPELTDVVVDAGGAVVRTARGNVRVGPSVAGWRALAFELGRRLESAPPVDTARPPVAPEEVAGWLGIPLDARLRCVPAPVGRRLVALVLFEGFLVWVLADTLLCFAEDAVWFPALLGGALLSPAPVFATSLLRDRLSREVRAGAWRLAARTGRRWREWTWAEVAAIDRVAGSTSGSYAIDQMTSRQPHRWHVLTTGGEFGFDESDVNAGRLAEALHRCVAERRLGRVVPGHEEVPDAALSISRATGVEAAERGLSRPAM